jgi:molecular chaperone GrpE
MADEPFETPAERAPAEPTEVVEPFETPRPSAPQEPPMAPPQSEPDDLLEPDPLVDGAAAEPADPDSQGRDEQLVASYLEQALSERTADLQRLQAEYVNYKRRVDRDRELVRENATYAALAPIVEVLDTIDRAREHGDLDEGFQAVADQLERVVANAGLVKYGEPGDAFDPRLHEALSHIGEDPEVEVTTCKVVAKAGYRIGERVVRAAQVLVVDPASSGG